MIFVGKIKFGNESSRKKVKLLSSVKKCKLLEGKRSEEKLKVPSGDNFRRTGLCSVVPHDQLMGQRYPSQ